MGSGERGIRTLCPDTVLLEGLAVPGSDMNTAQADVKAWINNSGTLE